jgi:hypothetical protein
MTGPCKGVLDVVLTLDVIPKYKFSLGILKPHGSQFLSSHHVHAESTNQFLVGKTSCLRHRQKDHVRIYLDGYVYILPPLQITSPC